MVYNTIIFYFFFKKKKSHCLIDFQCIVLFVCHLVTIVDPLFRIMYDVNNYEMANENFVLVMLCSSNAK